MKKIITSLGMIVFVAAVVVGGTGAFFSDTETSTGNVFTAGALDLKVDSVGHINGLVCFAGAWHPETIVAWNSQTAANGLNPANVNVTAAVNAYNLAYPSNVPKAGTPCASTWTLTDLGPANVFFNFGDLKPGDNGENTISLHVNNNDAYMCAAIHNVKSDDNGLTEPESAAGDVTGGLGQGELHQELEFIIWEDDGDNILQLQEIGVNGSGILYEGLAGAGLAGVYPLYTPLTGGVFPGGSTKYLGVYWCYGDLVRSGATLTCNGAPVTNMSQTDSLEASITFYIEQARNNSGFVCPSLDRFQVVEPERQTIGAALSDYSAPVEGCDVAVGGDGGFLTIQAAIDDVNTTNGETICVADGIYNENVNINKEIRLLGDGAANTSVINAQGGSQSAAINITANNVTVRGFVLNGHSNGTAVVYVNGSVNNVEVDSNLINVGSPDGFLTTGGVNNVTVSNNEFVGDGVNAQRLAYVNGLASVAVNSSNVDFFDNTFAGTLAGTMVMGHEGSGSEVRRNVFNLNPAYAVIEAWMDSVIITTNNFNGVGGIKVAQMENGNTGAQGTVDASGNWWGDPDPAGNTSGDVDTFDAQAVAYPLN